MTTSRNPPYTLKLLKRPLAGKGAGSYKIAKTAADGEKARKKVSKAPTKSADKSKRMKVMRYRII